MIVPVSSGLDTFTRDVETNESAQMLVEDNSQSQSQSQSQAFSSSVGGSESVEKTVRFGICSLLSIILPFTDTR